MAADRSVVALRLDSADALASECTYFTHARDGQGVAAKFNNITYNDNGMHGMDMTLQMKGDTGQTKRSSTGSTSASGAPAKASAVPAAAAAEPTSAEILAAKKAALVESASKKAARLQKKRAITPAWQLARQEQRRAELAARRAPHLVEAARLEQEELDLPAEEEEGEEHA